MKHSANIEQMIPFIRGHHKEKWEPSHLSTLQMTLAFETLFFFFNDEDDHFYVMFLPTIENSSNV